MYVLMMGCLFLKVDRYETKLIINCAGVRIDGLNDEDGRVNSLEV